MRPQQPPLQQGHDDRDSRQQLAGRLLPTLQHGESVRVPFAFQPGVALPPIGGNEIARLNGLLDERL